MPAMATTPAPAPLSGRDRQSFAFPTLKERVPVIICKVIDHLHRTRNSRTEEQRHGIKEAVQKMAQLRYELQTNKPMKYIVDGFEDDAVWNAYLDSETRDNEGEAPKWFHTKWLYAECYAYRRLKECINVHSSLKDIDYFEAQKKESFEGSIKPIGKLIRKLELLRSDPPTDKNALKHDLVAMLKIALWGNKCDLSISSGASQAFEGDPEAQVLALEGNLIVDDTQLVWDHLSGSPPGVVDIVLDNVGFELVSDLCLADFLVHAGLAAKIRLRAKADPWFVSDVMPVDLEWTLKQLTSLGNDRAAAVVDRWRSFISQGVWEVHADPFWTYPHDYTLMETAASSLYKSLTECSLVVFKGDLNYRKLVGDLAWSPTTDFATALQNFRPAPLVTVRTLKADVVTGLKDGQAELLSSKDPDWMINGNWGMISFARS